NKRAATLWLHVDLAAQLRQMQAAGVSPGRAVFTVPKPETVRADLEAAGIERVDRLGRRADLHALRMTFCTNLAAVGAPVRVAMEAMRHSDAKLTTKIYTDAGHLDTAAAVDLLPRYDVEPLALAATGTEGAKKRSHE